MTDLNEHEIDVLQMVGGQRPWAPWGAWVGACLEFLQEKHYITGWAERPPLLTQKGREFLGLEKSSED